MRLVALMSLCALMGACDRLPFTAEGAARAQISDRLIDPYSVRFKYLATTKTAVCGLFNAKNRMGAYTGQTAFIADRGSGRVTTFDEPPTIGDYRDFSDLPSQSEGSTTAYDRLETGCSFKAEWIRQCKLTWSGSEADPKLCALWQAQDWDGLIRLAEQ